jgi:anti-sigma factor RsiW
VEKGRESEKVSVNFRPGARFRDGFPLVGGRLDYLGGREVAVLVYQRRKHFINVFVWPDAAGSSSMQTIEPRQGYNMMRWSRGGFQFWAVSDVSASDLAEFVRLLEPRIAPKFKEKIP